MPKPIDAKQIQLIHIAKAQLGLSDEEYRELLMARYAGCFEGSSKELTYAEAEDLIEHLKSLGFEIKRKPRPRRPKGIPEVFTEAHPMAGKIERLREGVAWRFEDGYERWLRKFLKKDRIATTAEAAKVIEALKAMRARQECEASGKGAVGFRRDGNISGWRWRW